MAAEAFRAQARRTSGRVDSKVRSADPLTAPGVFRCCTCRARGEGAATSGASLRSCIIRASARRRRRHEPHDREGDSSLLASQSLQSPTILIGAARRNARVAQLIPDHASRDGRRDDADSNRGCHALDGRMPSLRRRRMT